MARKYKAKQKTHTIFSGAAMGVLISVLFSALCAGVLAALAVNERIPVSAVKYGVLITQAVASLLGAALAGKLVEEKKALTCAASSAVYFVVLLCATMLFFDGQFKNIWTGLVAVILAGIAAIAICARQGGKSGASVLKRKMRSR